jgi:succinate dehydrogenase/fumarate reductase flavoprotein subunit
MKEGKMAEEKEAPKKVSRREFVKGAAVGGAGVAAAGMLASCAPVATPAPGQTAAPAPTCPPAAECPPAETPWLPDKWDKEADVVVVGYGGAGPAAAIEAARAGAKVLLLEKLAEGQEGGNTFASGGTMWFANNLEGGFEYCKGLCLGTTSDDLLKHQLKAMKENVEWAMSLEGGEAFVIEPTETEYPDMPGFEAQEASGITNPKGGTGLIEILAQNLDKEGVEVMWSTPATKLIQNPFTKEILGLWADNEGVEIAVKAKRGVVLAAGGFEFNQEMLNSYIGPFPHYGTGTYGNTGDGIKMAMEVGADLKNMMNPKGYRPCAMYPKIPGMVHQYFFRTEHRVGGSSIAVNRYGVRFMDESEHERHGKRLARYWLPFYCDQPEPGHAYEFANIPLYMIFDEAKRLFKPLGSSSGWVARKEGYKWSADSSVEIAAGMILKGDTLAELAAEINAKCPAAQGKMKAEVLENTVNKYNGYCAAGCDPEFGRGCKPGSLPEWLVPIGAGPYYSLELWPGTSATEGGPKRNEKAQVLNRYDMPIPRLYAAGEMGSVWGAFYQGGGNVSEAIASGRYAGTNAAAETPWA